MRAKAWVAWAFMAPTLITMAVIVFLPLVQAIFWTFTDFDQGNQGSRFKPPSWQLVGLENYVNVLTDPRFWSNGRSCSGSGLPRHAITARLRSTPGAASFTGRCGLVMMSTISAL